MPEVRKDTHQKLGDMLVQQGMININQLNEALKVQSQSGGRIGSILLELGHIDIDQLLEFLGNQMSIPTANLYELTIKPAVLAILPFNKMKEYEVLPLSIGDRSVTVAMVNPTDLAAARDLEFILGRNIQPVKVPSLQMAAALKIVEDRGCSLDEPIHGSESKWIKLHQRMDINMLDIKQLFQKLVEENASDLLLTAGVPPCFKKGNEIKRLSASFMTPEQIKAYAYELTPADQRYEFERAKELERNLTCRTKLTGEHFVFASKQSETGALAYVKK